MKLEFTKMQGLGNDFIVIDSRWKKLKNIPRLVRRFSHRRFGIGFDQALILSSSKKADFRMDIYNADGGQVEMCGNGIRCFAKYIWDRHLSGNEPLRIETVAGIIKPERSGRMVRVDMGEPVLEGKDIPIRKGGDIIDYPLNVLDEYFLVTCVSMGNPHCVIFTDDVDAFPVGRFGPLIEKDKFFPNRTNVEFVEVLSRNRLKVRVWERGAGETLACGTGGCATLVAASLKGLTGRKARAHLPGGDLSIEWSKVDNHIYMTGPAEEVFEGVVEV